MSGTLIAYELLTRSNPPKSVVILEAREMCSGATGRNAGHCKPDQVCVQSHTYSNRILTTTYSVPRFPEIREAVWRRTGKEGRQCNMTIFNRFTKHSSTGFQLLEHEFRTWSRLVQFVHKEKVDCDLWVGDTVCFSIYKSHLFAH
jgi:glycine/D-amino acid oxidase-like deaminating enzyme